MANTIKIREKFDLIISVRKGTHTDLESILKDNCWAFNAVQMIYFNVIEFTIYNIDFKGVEALKKLMRDKNIKYY